MTQSISSRPSSLSHGTENPPFAIWKGRFVSIEMKRQIGQYIDKIAHLFERFFLWLKQLSSTESSELETRIKKAPLELPPVDLQFLKPDDPAYNLKRLSTITTENRIQSVSTERAYQMVPQLKANALGYDDPSDYQTILGDRVIAIETALIALGILGISRGTIFACLLNRANQKFETVYPICQNYAADFWQNTTGSFLLGGSAFLLGLTLFAHHKGLIGPLLYDRSSDKRQREIESLLYEAAQELLHQADVDPEKAKLQGAQILTHLDLIEATLRMELQLPKAKTKAIIETLKRAAKTALVPPLFPMSEAPSNVKEKPSQSIEPIQRKEGHS